MIFQFIADTETPLDISLFVLLIAALLIAFIAIVLSAGDLQAARREMISGNPNFTAALQSLVSDAMRALVLISMFGLVFTRLIDRALTGQAILYSVTFTIVDISSIFFINLYFRKKLRNEAEILIDPCADCPHTHSPYRELAKRNRVKRGLPVQQGSVVSTSPDAEVHVMVIPHTHETGAHETGPAQTTPQEE